VAYSRPGGVFFFLPPPGFIAAVPETSKDRSSGKSCSKQFSIMSERQAAAKSCQ
jgi:hypothetical protein